MALMNDVAAVATRPLIRSETCANCKFSVKQAQPLGSKQLNCRRNPPMPIVLPVRGNATLGATWPVVEAHQWCGEHKRRFEEAI